MENPQNPQNLQSPESPQSPQGPQAGQQGRNGRLGLGPLAGQVARVAAAIDDERLGDPTPCPEYAVRELLAHVLGLSVSFRDAARKDLGATTSTPPGSVKPVLPDDWRAALPRRLDELAAAWRDPAAWEGDTQAGGLALPAPAAGRIALNELLIHGWDLARATGQRYEVTDGAALESSYALLLPPEDGSGEGGLFGPIVPVPDDAPLLDRVIGLSGRSPGWSPHP